jgi:hypothetical protein
MDSSPIEGETIMNTTPETVTHCQVCGRVIKSNTGVIAHHGYKREAGWQSDSCLGARYLPYEESCERLKEVALIVEDYIKTNEAGLEKLLAEPPQTLKVFERRSSFSPEVAVEYTKPEGFTKDSPSYRPHTYEDAYARQVYNYQRSIRLAKADLANMQHRIQDWKPAEIAQ